MNWHSFVVNKGISTACKVDQIEGNRKLSEEKQYDEVLQHVIIE